MTSLVRFISNARPAAVTALSASMLVAMSVNQAIAAGGDDNALEEVVVTAQFREQNLQQTPIAITAVNAAMLEQRNQTDISQVAAQAPNVTLTQNGAAFGASMVAFIRGVGQTDFNLALEPGVGIYVDDVYYATLTGSLLDLLDLDRVEILRGPQGTLAGKNSIGGAVKLFSQKPKGSDSGYVELGAGDFNRINARGAADFALVPDKLFIRASFASKHHEGYVTRLDYSCDHPGSNLHTRNVGNLCELGKEGSQAFNAARVALRWIASDNVEVNIAGDGTNDQSSVQANTLLKVGGAGAGALGGATYVNGVAPNSKVFFGPQFIPSDPYTSYATYQSANGSAIFGPDPYAPAVVDPINHYRTWGISGDVKWTLSDDLNLTSITAYRDYSNSFAENTDASPIGVQVLLQRQFHHQFTQELRLNGKVGTVDYTLGGFYLDQNGGLNARVALPWVGFDFIHGPDSTPAKTKAAFANAEWHITDAFTASGGIRRSDEQKTYTYFRHNADNSTVVSTGYNALVAGLNGTTARFSGKRTDYRVALSYQFTDAMTGYVQTATGYKGGGVNPRPFIPAQALPFDPEKLTAYEVGLKTNLFDNTVRFNTAVFYNDYRDIQLTLSQCLGIVGLPCALPSNVGSAHVKGAEMEFEAHPVAGLEFDGSVSYIDFQYKKITDPSTFITLDMVTPYTSKYKASLGLQYEMQAGSGSFTPRVDIAYQAGFFTSAINDPAWNRIGGRTTANARLTWKDSGDKWSAALAINNLTDKLYYTTLFDNHTSVGYVSGQPAMPRNWTLSVKRTFN
jgi:iron complex outermembrane recepter protein